MKLLSGLCAQHSLLPRSLQIKPHYDPMGIAHSCGGSADVWKGEYRGSEVAVKVFRRYTNSLQKVTHVSYQ